jgi:hypothetical protein
MVLAVMTLRIAAGRGLGLCHNCQASCDYSLVAVELEVFWRLLFCRICTSRRVLWGERMKTKF